MAEARREKPAAASFSACLKKAISLGETEKGSEGESNFRPLFAPQSSAGEESRLSYTGTLKGKLGATGEASVR